MLVKMFDRFWCFLMLNAALIYTANATPAQTAQFPYKVAILDYGDLSNVRLLCGGALIREDTVLTAAECMRHDVFLKPKMENIDVIGGSLSITSQMIHFRSSVIKITLHDNYTEWKNKEANNIALLKLAQRIPSSNLLGTVALAKTPPTVGTICQSTIWPNKKDLQFFQLPIRDIEDCHTNLLNFPRPKDSMLCTGYDKVDFATFQSDEGGPLVCNDQLAGIGSLTSWLPQEELGGAFLDVTQYTSWIEQNYFEGRLAIHGHHPYLVYITEKEYVDENLRQYYCVGTLIDKDTVLTTADCVPININNSRVIIGAVRTPESDSEEGESIKQIRIHKDFNYTTKENNIGIIKLENPVSLTKFPSLVKEKSDTNCTAVGFGSNGRLEDSKKVKILLEVDLTTFDEKDCSYVYSNMSTRSRICAGDPGRVRNFCEGDLGGPLLCNGILRGMYSHGKSCTDGAAYPAVYTDVADYIDWIENSSWNISANILCIFIALISSVYAM